MPPSDPTLAHSYTYDRFGNRWNQTVTTGTGTQMSLTFNGSNQITTIGYQYEAAGNVLTDNANCYTYDGENRISSVAILTALKVCGTAADNNLPVTSYLYGPDGKRIARVQNGAVVEQDYYDADGNEIAVTNGSGSLQRAEIYAGGRHLATWSNSATYFNHADWLGTERVRSNSSGTVCETITSLPFGDGLSTSGNCGDPSPDHFTGKERDAESGNDYFGARYFGSLMGRMLSPDPLGGSPANPQSLNKYAYGFNNPLTNTDPTGLYVCKDDAKAATEHCTSKQDKDFEVALDKLRGKDGDVGRAAAAYGKAGDANGVTVGFADVSKKGEGGDTVSHVGSLDGGDTLSAISDVTISTKVSGAELDAAIGHEGSHVADAQDVVKSGISSDLVAGADITRYQSEHRAYGVTSAILRSENEPGNFSCGVSTCSIGTGLKLQAQLPGIVDQILASSPRYNVGGKPMSSTNQGGSVINGLIQAPKVTVPH